MNFSFTEEQNLIRQNVIDFVKKELSSDAVESDRQQLFSRLRWQKCASQKLVALPVDEKFGGAGLDPLTSIAALEALGYASDDGGLNFSIGAHLLACLVPIWKFGTNAQKERYLPDLCNGNKIAINAMTETTSGSDVFNLSTKARKVDNGYIINGTKSFCSNGPFGDLVLLYALTDESKGYFGGITAFIVDVNTPGVKVGQVYEKMGLRTSGISEMIFDEVLVDDACILGGVGAGATIFNYSMEWERIGMSSMHVGAMKRLVEQSIAYAQTRKSGVETISKKQAIAHTIANMKVQIEASSLLTYKAASELDKSRDNMVQASVAKLFVSEAFVKVAMDTMQLFGGNGYMTDYGIERIVRDALGSTIYSGTSEIQRNIISRMIGL